MESIIALEKEAPFEFIIVDNNSTDDTKETVEKYAGVATYVFEKNTAFTRARTTGADNASGDVLIFMDDDIIVNSGALKTITSVFEQYHDCGVIACKILPNFESQPPDWTLACQRSFNGWSLYSPEIDPRTGSGFQEVESAAGPMMAVSRRAYETAGGFPPDTVGVETNTTKNSFRKLYVGPGDYGLCHLIRKNGYKVYYAPKVSCYHMIPELRFSIPFWRSRMIGEAHHVAITARQFFMLSKFKLFKKQLFAKVQYRRWKRRLTDRLKRGQQFLMKDRFEGMLYEEVWYQYYLAYEKIDSVLNKHPGLSAFLWETAKEGVSNNDFEAVVNKFPPEFSALVDAEYMYHANPITTVKALNEFENRYARGH
jgi:glycosyltransferase involved in cell wall biosynthesis